MQHTRIAASATWSTHEGERNQILHVCPIPSKRFFDNVQKVPENLKNNSAFHLCMDLQVQWIVHDKKVATVHEHPDLFKPQHGSGPDALAKEIIANVTHSYVNDVYLFVGEPISAGYEQCDTARLDWEQDKRMHNLSDVHTGMGRLIRDSGSRSTILTISQSSP